MLVSAGVFALAAAAHGLRYGLLLINRNSLLPPLVADGALLMGVMLGLAAIAAMIATMAVTTAWLIGHRAQTFRLRGHADPRPEWTLWAGCMTPLVNLVWAPVFVIELARIEKADTRIGGRITAWWIAWTASALLAVWATWTSSATEPQAVADNTITAILAYLVGAVALVLLWRVIDGFINRPVRQSGPAHRWVIVAEPAPVANLRTRAESAESTDSEPGNSDVESRDPEPAA